MIHLGHPPAVAWGYTPRQLFGWLQLADRRRGGELAQLASVMRLAQSTDTPAVRRAVAKMQEESE